MMTGSLLLLLLWSFVVVMLSILSYRIDAFVVGGFGFDTAHTNDFVSRKQSWKPPPAAAAAAAYTFSLDRQARTSRSTRLYYFDDISRYSLEDANIYHDGESNNHKINSNEDSSSSSTALPDAMRTSSVQQKQEQQARFHKDKTDALRRLLGYCNSDSAATLTKKEIKALTKEWAKKSKLYHHLSKVSQGNNTSKATALPTTTTSIKVCSSTTMIGCLAYYWKIILQQTQKKEKKNHGAINNNDAMMIVFPYCNDLYVYEKLSLLNAAIRLGNTEQRLSLYHPKYMNAPSIFSPERHSPFPTVGLGRWLQELHQEQQEQHMSSYGFGISDQPKQQLSLLPLDDSVYLDQQRLNLERLYNSAAATTTQSFIPSDELIQECQTWYTKYHTQKEEQQFLEKEQQQDYDESQMQLPNKKDADDDDDDDSIIWLVSPATTPEEAYAHVFAAIQNTTSATAAFTMRSSSSKRTMMILMPRYCPYNAPQWRQFCITINAILKRFHSDTKTNSISIQNVFHPEWTNLIARKKDHDDHGNYHEDIRQRAPCSILQIHF